MPESTPPTAGRRKRADAVRNQQALLDAAAAVFVRSGVDAPVREVATEAGVGLGTIYRHFPTRADLVVAVFRHQLDALAEVEPAGAATTDPYARLRAWVRRFVDFLVTKHGLAEALQSDRDTFESLHAGFIARLLPVCEGLLVASVDARRIRADVQAYDLLRAVGNLCIGVETDSRYGAHQMVEVLLDGLRRVD